MSVDSPTPTSPIIPPVPPEPDVLNLMLVLLRAGGQILGVILLLIGVYYVLVLLGGVLSAANNPAVLEGRIASMAKTLDIEGAQLEVNNDKIPYGRTVGMAALFAWNLLAVFIATSLIQAGGRLIWGPVSERRAMFAAMEEIARASRELPR